MSKIKEGWGMPGAAIKAHYFIGKEYLKHSLCKKWIYTGQLEPDNGKPNLSDCKVCSKKLRERKEEKENGW